MFGRHGLTALGALVLMGFGPEGPTDVVRLRAVLIADSTYQVVGDWGPSSPGSEPLARYGSTVIDETGTARATGTVPATQTADTLIVRLTGPTDQPWVKWRVLAFDVSGDSSAARVSTDSIQLIPQQFVPPGQPGPVSIDTVGGVIPPPPDTAPPIPGLGAWASNMTTFAGNYCTISGSNPGPHNEAGVWYYDGTRVFYQIADYTGDDSWKQCATNIANSYAAAANGPNTVTGYRVFTKGLRRHYEETGSQSSYDGVNSLANRSPFSHGRFENYVRERAFMIQAWQDWEAISGNRNPNLETAITQALPFMEAGPNTGSNQETQAFMLGLLGDALIQYFEQDPINKGDPRILPAIKLAVDQIWAKCTQGTDVIPCGNYDPDLYMLIAPMFYWVYAQGEGDLYATRGDELFNLSAQSGWLGGGKQFSQAYRWSFAGVNWRAQ